MDAIRSWRRVSASPQGIIDLGDAYGIRKMGVVRQEKFWVQLMLGLDVCKVRG